MCVQSPGNSALVKMDPTLAEVETALRELKNDTDRSSIIFSNASTEDILNIGGGRELFVVGFRQESGEEWIVSNGSKAANPVLVTTGGQEIDVPSRFAVRIADALQAARHFCVHGSRSPELLWESVAH